MTMQKVADGGVAVTFVEDRKVVDHAGEVEAHFRKGKTYELAAASAERWLRRGAAELKA